MWNIHFNEGRNNAVRSLKLHQLGYCKYTEPLYHFEAKVQKVLLDKITHSEWVLSSSFAMFNPINIK